MLGTVGWSFEDFARFADEDRWEIYTGDTKFRPPLCRYFYPDYMLTPSPPRLADAENDVLLDPKFLAEVLSRTTGDVDRGDKLRCYRGTPSVLEYWLVRQDRVHVERHHRPAEGGTWDVTEYAGRDAAVPLPFLGGTVPLAALYRRVPAAG